MNIKFSILLTRIIAKILMIGTSWLKPLKAHRFNKVKYQGTEMSRGIVKVYKRPYLSRMRI